MANNLFMQAIMELICTGKYISWNLPKNTNIVLSSNPDDSSYNVSSLDPAQKSRFINFSVKFNIDAWASWAESNELDNRAINFLLHYSSEIFKDDNKVSTINPRSYVTFCNAISGIKDWSIGKNLALILNIAKGCFGDEDNIVGHLFTQFIANKLDKLISPKDLLLKDWNIVKEQIKNSVYDDNGNYRPEIASILHTRLLNYSIAFFEKKGSKTDVVQDRLLKLIDSSNEDDKMLFSEDFLFNIIKILINKFPSRTNKFILNPKIKSKVL